MRNSAAKHTNFRAKLLEKTAAQCPNLLLRIMKTTASRLARSDLPPAPLALKPAGASVSACAMIGLGAAALSAQSIYAQVTAISSIPNITFGAANGGLSAGTGSDYFSPTGAGYFYIVNQSGNANNFGFGNPNGGAQFAVVGSGSATLPQNFAQGATIGSGSTFSANQNYARFGNNYRSPGPFAPDFGPNSYIGFIDGANHYGYFEVTWNSATKVFTVLGGAFEATPGVSILAGGAIPEPSTYTALAGLLAGSAALYRRRQQKQAAA